MANYKEQTVSNQTIQSWQRSNHLSISNTLDETPRISFSEEIITKLGNDVIKHEPTGGLNLDYDPEYEIDLINPTTGESLNSTMTLEDLYVAIYSLYIQLANERDAE